MAESTKETSTGRHLQGGEMARRARLQLGLRPVSFHPIGMLTKLIIGGKTRFMELASFASRIEPGLACIVESYESLNPTLRPSVSIDEIYVKHHVDPCHYVAVVGEAALRFKNNSAILIAAMSMPEIVVRSVMEAVKPSGVNERKMLFQHAGFIPTSCTSTRKVADQVATAADTYGECKRKSLPSFEETMRQADKIIRAS